jgi:hypothetical protein
MAGSHSYHLHIHRSMIGGGVRWSVMRSRWTVGTAGLSSLVADGALPDLVVPAGTPLFQASQLVAAIAAELAVQEAQASGELDQRP